MQTKEKLDQAEKDNVSLAEQCRQLTNQISSLQNKLKIAKEEVRGSSSHWLFILSLCKKCVDKKIFIEFFIVSLMEYNWERVGSNERVGCDVQDWWGIWGLEWLGSELHNHKFGHRPVTKSAWILANFC